MINILKNVCLLNPRRRRPWINRGQITSRINVTSVDAGIAQTSIPYQFDDIGHLVLGTGRAGWYDEGVEYIPFGAVVLWDENGTIGGNTHAQNWLILQVNAGFIDAVGWRAPVNVRYAWQVPSDQWIGVTQTGTVTVTRVP